jgi:hypothetical protein
MNRDHIVKLLIGVAVVGLGVWVAMHTYWDTITVPTPMKGDAARNPYYSIEHLAQNLGVRVQEIASLRALRPDAVVWVNDLRDDLLHQPLQSLETWVEAGGRLIISGDMLWANTALQNWSGVRPVQRDTSPPAPAGQKLHIQFDPDQNCSSMTVKVHGTQIAGPLRVCAPAGFAFSSDRLPAWSLSDAHGNQVMRVGIGFGELTVIGPRWIAYNKTLLRADHAEVLVASAGLRHGDTLLILSPSKAEPLIALLWRLAAPAILFLSAAMILLILRNVPRFGPPLPAPQAIRRSLAEQIRANARFAWRTRKLESLRAAARRSLDEVAQRQIIGYGALDMRRRADSLAASTGIDSVAINAALTLDTANKMSEHRAAILLLELCRRILVKSRPTTKGASHAR